MKKIITVIGATAVGKSDFAVQLAKKFNGEIISADSRQIYKNLNLSTGKITQQEMQGIKHYLIDIVDVGTPYSVYNFVQDATKCINNILLRGKLPIICGGTGLYTRAIVEGYNMNEQNKNVARESELAKLSVDELQNIVNKNNIFIVESDKKNPRRLINAILKFENGVVKKENKSSFDYLQICLTCEREVLRERIKTRLQKRIDFGMIEEIKNVLASGGNKEFLKTLGLDIKNTILYLDNKFNSFNEFFEKAYVGDCQYAKRQNTWFKKEKNCIYLNVLNKTIFEDVCKEIEKFLSN